MRRRQPGFYVSVRIGSARAAGLPRELLDGPWPSFESAQDRAGELEVQKSREGVTCKVVRVAEDGVTVLREDES
ncbi:MAG: hypothetical protein ACREJP_09770 [Candidatus Methylomirabilales bacterium]